MSIFSALLESWRQRDRPADARLYYDAPVTIKASHLDEIAEILRATGQGQITLFVNRKPLQLTHGHGYVERVADRVQMERRYDEPESISITNGVVSVYFARAASASSTSSLPQHMGSLWAVRRVLDDARWKTGTLLFRYWGALLLVVAAFLAAVHTVSVVPPLVTWVALGGMLLVMAITLGIGVLRRVRLDVRTAEERSRGKGLDLLLSSLVYPLLLATVTPLIPPLYELISRQVP